MASASAKTATGGLHLILPVFLPVGASALAYAAYKINWINFFTGPGRYSRLALLLFVIANWKSMPFVWTTRVFYALIHHTRLLRRPNTYPPRTLWHPSITTSRVTLMETDYNMHKSNSTYFADLDISRSHLVTHLMAGGLDAVAANATTKVARDTDGNVVVGTFGIMLGSVHTSFKKEIPPYVKYEMWSRILAWDRKWLYVATFFVQAGTVKPKSWDWVKYGGRRADTPRAKAAGRQANGTTTSTTTPNGAVATNGSAKAPEEQDWQRRIYAASVTKYVFKLGRFTVHPAIPIQASGLLPERPGGWRGGGPEDVGDEAAAAEASKDLGERADTDDSEWDWRNTEMMRQRGMKFARHFAALDGMYEEFDGGEDGVLGKFPYG